MDERPLAPEINPQSAEEEAVVTKLVQSSDLKSPVIEPWKLSSFAEENAQSDKAKLSDEVYQQMQEALQPKLQQQAEVLKQEAYDKAFQKGYEEGLSKGHEEGAKLGETEAKSQVQETLQPKIEQFVSIIDSLQKPYDALEEKLYADMVDFALHIAETVINKSVLEQKDWVVKSVQEAVATLPESSSEINVYLHPDDLAFIQISKPNISENWQLHESANVSQGSCMVKQDYSTVLNSWKARFDEISEQIAQDSTIDIQTSQVVSEQNSIVNSTTTDNSE